MLIPSFEIAIGILLTQTVREDDVSMKLWAWDEKNLPSITHAVRTAVAATVSVIIARLVQMPEAYWAAIATLVVMQSTVGATLTLSIERIVATPVGASVGALEANYFGANLVRVRDCDLSRRIALDRVPFGEDRVSLRERYPHHHRSNSALGCTVDHRAAQIP
jgi:aromatic acid exporter family member 1